MIRTLSTVAAATIAAAVATGAILVGTVAVGASLASDQPTDAGVCRIADDFTVCAPSFSPSGAALVGRVEEDGSARYADGMVFDADDAAFRPASTPVVTAAPVYEPVVTIPRDQVTGYTGGNSVTERFEDGSARLTDGRVLDAETGEVRAPKRQAAPKVDSGLQEAKRLIAERQAAGLPMFEDLTWHGAPDVVTEHNDEILGG